MSKRKYPRLSAALDQESWQWLQDTIPSIADALQDEVSQGADPDEIERFFKADYGVDREKLGKRLKQAARHLQGESAKA